MANQPHTSNIQPPSDRICQSAVIKQISRFATENHKHHNLALSTVASGAGRFLVRRWPKKRPTIPSHSLSHPSSACTARKGGVKMIQKHFTSCADFDSVTYAPSARRLQSLIRN